ncbi:hypothetical protein CRUP_037658 [Coryphaenoides rupestris]|nr:hypothetical protein CRUP_037658 [Coryphaenoides rupestris]
MFTQLVMLGQHPEVPLGQHLEVATSRLLGPGSAGGPGPEQAQQQGRPRKEVQAEKHWAQNTICTRHVATRGTQRTRVVL